MSLRLRLLLAFGYVLLLVIVLLEVPLALNLSSRVDAEVKAEAVGQAQILAASASGRLDRQRELERLVRRSAQSLGGRVIVVDARGRLLMDSAGRGLGSTSYASRPEIARALAGTPDQGTRHSESLDEELLFTSVPVVERGRTAGAVRVTQSVDAVNSEVRGDILLLVAVGAGALGLGLAVAWFIAGSLVRPLRGLAATALRIAGGDLSARAEPVGSTEQREMAVAFNEMTERLGKALTSQREFAGNASHQLRTPLTGLRLRLEAASFKTQDPDLRGELAAAERETERLAGIVSNLLALTRDGDGSSADAAADLAAVVQEAAGRWSDMATERGSTVELRGGESVWVRVSAADLGVICDNLIENALAYSPDGGKVLLEWGQAGAQGWLAVCDEGPGLRPDELQRVFERFYRGSSAGRSSGSGLGLTVVQMLAKRWGGRARMENRSKGGARAVLTFERARAAPGAMPPPGQQAEVSR